MTTKPNVAKVILADNLNETLELLGRLEAKRSMILDNLQGIVMFTLLLVSGHRLRRRKMPGNDFRSGCHG